MVESSGGIAMLLVLTPQLLHRESLLIPGLAVVRLALGIGRINLFQSSVNVEVQWILRISFLPVFLHCDMVDAFSLLSVKIHGMAIINQYFN
jgi:hypothetical protein